MSIVKQYFYSRFPEGNLMQADFSQLEVIVLAVLSGDERLKEDLRAGVDMHCMSTAFLTGKPYERVLYKVKVEEDPKWIKLRKSAKGVSFAAQYGAGPKTISKNTGIDEEEVRKFLENYYDRYQTVGEWQSDVSAQVTITRSPSKARTERGLPAGKGFYVSPTNRRYVFTEYDAPEWVSSGTSFSPTQLKNYPVQGTATGDIVPLALGVLYRELRKKLKKVLLVNTIHDSVLLDIPKDMEIETARLVKRVLEDTPTYYEQVFHKAFDLPLKVDIEYGPTWATMKPLSV